MKTLTVKHSGGAGDIIYSLPTLMSLRETHGIGHVTFCLQLDQPTQYSGWHPLGNLLLDADFATKLRPLLLAQPYIDEVVIYSGQPIDVNFDMFRTAGLNFASYSIPRWYFLLFTGINRDLSLPWIVVEPDTRFRDFVLVGRNPRLQSPWIRYDFMNEFAERIVFVGVPREFEEFRAQCPAITRFFEAGEFLELARVLAGCRFYAGNQGLLYTLAEAMKIPRLLETNVQAANNIPQGGPCYDALYQRGFEHWFRALMSS